MLVPGDPPSDYRFEMVDPLGGPLVTWVYWITLTLWESPEKFLDFALVRIGKLQSSREASMA